MRCMNIGTIRGKQMTLLSVENHRFDNDLAVIHAIKFIGFCFAHKDKVIGHG